MKERDEIDDIFRSGLQDWEADTLPGDWEAIAGRLDKGKRIPLRRTLRYWAAAAVASIALVTGSIFWYNQELIEEPIARQLEQQQQALQQPPRLKAASPLQEMEPAGQSHTVTTPVASIAKHTAKVAAAGTGKEAAIMRSVIPVITPDAEDKISLPAENSSEITQEPAAPVANSAETSASSLPANADVPAKKEQGRRWGFGMGGGSVTAGNAQNSIQTFALRSTTKQSEELMYLNSAASNFTTELPKTNIRHKTPVSVGMSVSYALNDRFSLLSGLTYSMLRSDWETNGQYHGETVRKLHFIGLPLSVAYKIAEWNNFHFYAAAGGMTEVNVAGRVNSKIMQDNNEIIKRNESERMKEWLWSVNARVGVSYPVFRYASLFAETGASYYFDNGSPIETIRSEKPFNVNLQFGVRLGF